MNLTATFDTQNLNRAQSILLRHSRRSPARCINSTAYHVIKDVVEAGGGMGSLAGRVGLKRPSLYKILSKKGNPTLATLQEILKPLGLRVSVALDKAA